MIECLNVTSRPLFIFEKVFSKIKIINIKEKPVDIVFYSELKMLIYTYNTYNIHLYIYICIYNRNQTIRWWNYSKEVQTAVDVCTSTKVLKIKIVLN